MKTTDAIEVLLDESDYIGTNGRGKRLDADTLRARLKEGLSAYKVPGKLFFCVKDEIPFTDSGKIDKRALLAMIEQASSQESA